MDINSLNAFDFEDRVDGHKQISLIFRQFLLQDAVAEAVVVRRHLQGGDGSFKFASVKRLSLTLHSLQNIYYDHF